jgi:hypothetical protein
VSTVSKDAGRELDRAIERDLRAVQSPPRIAYVLGIDPGAGATGITLLELNWATLKLGARSFACNAGAAEWLLRAILDDTGDRCGPGQVRGGIEAFAPGNGAGARMKTGQVTRDLVTDLAGVCAEYGVPLTARFASLAKTWATDARLRKAGLYDLTGKSPDMRDSSRHALLEACQNCGWPDPISHKKAASG